MAELHILNANVIPQHVCGTHSGYAVRVCRPDERLSLEDALFQAEQSIDLPQDLVAVVFPEAPFTDESVRTHVAISEFALGVAAVAGYPAPLIASAFAHGKCKRTQVVSGSVDALRDLTFARTLSGLAMAQWLQLCAEAARKLGERFPMTARRYARYLRGPDPYDAILDLTISLESLLSAQTEIAFRFAVSLAKVAHEGGADIGNAYQLLKVLYDVRSKIAHGDPKLHKTYAGLAERLDDVRDLSRRIMTRYIMFLQDGTRKEWKTHLRDILLQ